ncbi:MAG TPA: prepilin-type N-terminal cleavage/methylation domain-containing protein [Syntrophales bacterium]|nr:prepilin-type N-terminal cleavage/methylation domain-containing protein [Syntrophales bacterium]
MRYCKGFSLIELIIVIVLIASLFFIMALNFKAYTVNKNLRAAARYVESDFAICKERAIAEGNVYQIIFTNGGNGYTIQYLVGGVVVPASQVVKSLLEFETDITVFSAAFGAPTNQTVNFSPRGIISPLGNPPPGDGVILTNMRGSLATVQVSSTGRTYVTFNMQ